MSEYTTDVYIDGEGGIYVYQVDATERVRWASAYHDMDGAEMASADFCGITVQCIDPITSGWGFGDFKSIEEAKDLFYAANGLELVASSDFYRGRDVDMLINPDPEECADLVLRRFTRSFLGE